MTGISPRFSGNIKMTRKARYSISGVNTCYLCKTDFSAMAALKSRYRNKHQIEKELRVSISNIKPNLDRLCTSKQAHSSH